MSGIPSIKGIRKFLTEHDESMKHDVDVLARRGKRFRVDYEGSP